MAHPRPKHGSPLTTANQQLAEGGPPLNYSRHAKRVLQPSLGGDGRFDHDYAQRAARDAQRAARAAKQANPEEAAPAPGLWRHEVP